jgi:hypothetical protein
MFAPQPRHLVLPIALFFALLLAARWWRDRHP